EQGPEVFLIAVHGNVQQPYSRSYVLFLFQWRLEQVVPCTVVGNPPTRTSMLGEVGNEIQHCLGRKQNDVCRFDAEKSQLALQEVIRLHLERLQTRREDWIEVDGIAYQQHLPARAVEGAKVSRRKEYIDSLGPQHPRYFHLVKPKAPQASAARTEAACGAL